MNYRPLIMWGLACVALLAMASTLNAAPLFEENFDEVDLSGWDTDKWVPNYPAGNQQICFPTLVEGSSDDYKLQLGGLVNPWDTGIVTANSFNRGENLCCQFKLWKGDDQGDIFGSFEGMKWVYNSCIGPWAWTNVWEAEGLFAIT